MSVIERTGNVNKIRPFHVPSRTEINSNTQQDNKPLQTWRKKTIDHITQNTRKLWTQKTPNLYNTNTAQHCGCWASSLTLDVIDESHHWMLGFIIVGLFVDVEHHQIAVQLFVTWWCLCWVRNFDLSCTLNPHDNNCRDDFCNVRQRWEEMPANYQHQWAWVFYWFNFVF